MSNVHGVGLSSDVIEEIPDASINQIQSSYSNEERPNVEVTNLSITTASSGSYSNNDVIALATLNSNNFNTIEKAPHIDHYRMTQSRELKRGRASMPELMRGNSVLEVLV